ncbi:MAG TPA: helicase-associated domain-containing protein [Anaerolineae bacterium]|nr:helicase-associated domain-containing protein [Anaerolineae bacterium]HQH38603.1 helicase-associated domain-containing protein [Anaerolineae bacterium]
MTEKLKAALDLYSMEALKAIAKNLNLAAVKPPMHKSALIDAVSNKIGEIAGSATFIGHLSQAERATLALLLRNDGVSTLHDITAPLVMAGLVYVEGQESTLACPRLEDVLLSLLGKGLIINLNEITGTATRRAFTPIDKMGIAPEVRAVLPRKLLPLPEPVLNGPTASAPPPHVESNDAEPYLRQLFFLWGELRREPADCLKSGEIAKRDRRRMAKSIGLDAENDLERLVWMQKILQALKMLTSSAGTISAIDNEAVKLFWNASPRTQLSTLLQSYPDIAFAPSLDMSFLAQYSYSAALTRPWAEIRRQVLNVLKETAGAGWFSVPLLMVLLNSGRQGRIALPDSTLNMLYTNLRWYPAKRRDELDSKLQQLDRQAVNAILTELHMLGVIELGYAAPGGDLVAFRLTPLARAYFTNQPFASSEESGQVILQPDFQILAMGPVALSILANLERFAAREKFSTSVVAYRITREATYQALQRGESPETICAFLEEATGQPVPQNISRTLEEWGAQYERIIIRRNITILQTDSADVLNELLHNPAVRPFLHRLDDRTVWMRAQHTAKIEAALKVLEMLPAYSQGPAADLPHSLEWEQDTLRPRHPLPSLYVAGTIRRMAEETDGRWQLTPSSVRRAVSTGLDIPDIIELLERMTGTPLSAEWHKQLKAWGKHYGSGQIAPVLLLHLESDEALQELRRADRRLSRWIHPLPQAPGLGVIDEKHWEELQSLLTEWGIDMKTERWW